MSIADRPVYATQPQLLTKQVTDLLEEAELEPIHGILKAIIVPDTNSLSGAKTAARIYKILEGREFDTVIIVTPSHTGSFERLNICKVDSYRTPLGEVPVNDFVRNELCDEDDDIFLDDTGHYHTEGVDVQLPFLQHILGRKFDIVPIVMGNDKPDFCYELGNAVGEIMYGRKTLVIGCADVLEASDQAAQNFRNYFEAMDISQLMHLLNSEEVLLEGKGAVLVAIIAGLRRMANRSRLVSYQPPHAGEKGFIGGVIWRE